MAEIIELDHYKTHRIAIHESDRQRALAALDTPPPCDVEWHAYDRTASPRRWVTVYAQTWVVARSKAAVLLGAAPEHVEASRA